MDGDLAGAVVGADATNCFRLAGLVGSRASNGSGVRGVPTPAELECPFYRVRLVRRLDGYSVRVLEPLA